MLKHAIAAIVVPAGRVLWPATAWLRLAVWSGLLLALVGAVVATSVRVSIERECKRGAFSGGFSSGFDVRRCGIKVQRLPTGLTFTVPLPASWF